MYYVINVHYTSNGMRAHGEQRRRVPEYALRSPGLHAGVPQDTIRPVGQSGAVRSATEVPIL